MADRGKRNWFGVLSCNDEDKWSECEMLCAMMARKMKLGEPDTAHAIWLHFTDVFQFPVRFAIAEELGLEKADRPEERYRHVHIYMGFPKQVTILKLREFFPVTHWEPAYGSPMQVLDYLYKRGKHIDKHDEFIEGAQFVRGEFDMMKDEIMSVAVGLISSGKTPYDVCTMYPAALGFLKQLDLYWDMHKTYNDQKGE
jgi:hypothetical protein